VTLEPEPYARDPKADSPQLVAYALYPELHRTQEQVTDKEEEEEGGRGGRGGVCVASCFILHLVTTTDAIAFTINHYRY
jgi:hypothetical protein